MIHSRAFQMILLFGASCHAQVTAAPILKSSDLQADAAILRKAYQELHPGLYRYNTREEMDAHFAELNQQLGHDQSLQDAFLAFSEFAAKVRCGHTQVNPFNQQKTVVDELFKSPTRLPFYFDWLDRQMVVTQDFTSNHVLPSGTEVTQIDGVPTSTILKRLLSIARADGANDGKRIAQLAIHGDSEYETFDIYFPLFFPQAGSRFTLQIRRPKIHKAEEITAMPLTFEERIAPIKSREEQREGGDYPLFESKDLPDKSEYLRMATWALYNSKWNWQQWLNERLNEAADRNAPALIIDLRGNEGGNDVGNEIIAHLIDAPIKLSSMSRLVRYRKVPDELLPYLDTWDQSFRDWGSSAIDMAEPWPTAPKAVPYLRLTRFDDETGNVIKPAGKRFRGKVFVLIDTSNSSATFQFVQIIQSHHLGTLVGQTTGGSQRGINGGAFFFLRLPHTGLEMDVPLIGTFPSLPAPDAGITPDIIVTSTIEDIENRRDAVMAVVLEAIRQ
jgi:C-terminal processing protease CtpA/Prc